MGASDAAARSLRRCRDGHDLGVPELLRDDEVVCALYDGRADEDVSLGHAERDSPPRRVQLHLRTAELWAEGAHGGCVHAEEVQ